MYLIESPDLGAKAKSVLPNNTVTLHYEGSFLMDGAIFDSSYDRKQPISLVLGKQSMIPGFEEGLLLAKKGQKLKLFIPYYLAYGEKAMGPIPSFSDLVFQIEILNVE